MELEKADKGTFEVGDTVKIGYVDQSHADIDPLKTVYQVISGGTEFIRVGGKEINARAFCQGSTLLVVTRKSFAESCRVVSVTGYIWQSH
jgi:ATPase subunit of ABC transporter with duplicated ATPase domains